jgi:hypothetical protein
MAIIFAGGDGRENRGRVTVLDRPGASPTEIITVPGWGGFTGFKSVITGFSLSEQANFQFQHSLGNEIFAYVFGDKIGQVTVGGLSFFDACDTGGLAGGPLGLARVREYYQRNKISTRPTPLLITLQPSTVLPCFLVAFRGQVADPALRLFEFALTLALIPESRV